jgi:hypothetical protein
MAKKTTKNPAKTAKKKTNDVTLERVFEATTRIHVQHTKALNEIKRMVENFEIRIMQRMDSRIDATTGRLLKDVLDMRNAIITETNAIDETVDRIERLLATPQDVTGTPVDIKVTIPEQGLEPGDYTDASKEVADALTAMGFKWGDGDRTECAYIVWDDVYNMILNSTCHDENKLPQAEFLSRAAVTAKKIWLVAKEEEPWKPEVGQHVKPSARANEGWVLDPLRDGVISGIMQGTLIVEEANGAVRKGIFDWRYEPMSPEEVAKYHADKEAAKPIGPYVTRVMCDGYEWRVICGMDQLKRYRIHRIEGEFEYCVSVQRHEFTVIDP